MSDIQHSVGTVSGYVNLFVHAHGGWDTGGGGMCYPDFKKDVEKFARHYKTYRRDFPDHLRLITDDECEYKRPARITSTMMKAMSAYLLLSLHDPIAPLDEADCNRYCVHLSDAIAAGDRYADYLLFDYSIDPQRKAHYRVRSPYPPERPIEKAARQATAEGLYALAEQDFSKALEKALSHYSLTGTDAQTPKVIQFVLDQVNPYLDSLSVSYEKDDYNNIKHYSVRALTWAARYVTPNSLQDRNLVQTWQKAIELFGKKDVFLTENLLRVVNPIESFFNPDTHDATPLMEKAVDGFLSVLKKTVSQRDVPTLSNPALPSGDIQTMIKLHDLLMKPHREDGILKRKLEAIAI